MSIAFIGLGHMGGPMALNLQRAGHAVQGFDLSPAARAQLAAAGLPIATDAAASVQGADIVISMLPANAHVEALYLGHGGQAGLLPQLAADTLVIDCSTIAASSARKVADAALAQQRGLRFIDAPVSGGTGGAVAGTLTFIVGGDEQALEQARPVLEKMGQNIFHAGGVGTGQTAKICNNMLLGILMAGTSEALALGLANGLDPRVLSDIMRGSSGSNWVLEKYNPMPGVMASAPASKGYAGGFGTDLMLKDLGLAQDSATAVQAATPLGSLARNLYAAHSLAGNGALDFSSIIRMLQKR
ncbi:3-hydroxyisobutyrate dehydrogenase [Verminephrobacter eiseniae]|uniref:3-hydroxyisobutyrate dehydrogenase n=1 Tax=Verminephrobacter eiseniae TaxID=364317 RepID=UPI002237DD16|nr:3-hydroxyisobutyrate dehydrogenase [Verminephrobacter eiseniae]MCW5284794.1 3-hydroxyisobutyrate dehydrogenase [Verminephrobacter eiseniae]MCW5302500.1 3-hydroxyisobutyrate dehydrogenase [Verminephrobacter eiseniae]MCW8178324.1 3-hydroxyisobutyrate dehydrogenase [Verminephrobacter eiseniae]MCW8189105.1 3-hydroxyisobutyrate dehydrogenase [Verminephrobacter eiseniae]